MEKLSSNKNSSGLTEDDKQRIEQAADIALIPIDYPDSLMFNKGFIEGAEYATLYERQQQIKTLNRPGSKYYVSYDPDYKDKVFGVFNKEDLTQQGAQKMAQQLNNLEAERSELRNKAEEYRRLLLRAEMYVLPTEQTNGLIDDIRNSLKTK